MKIRPMRQSDVEEGSRLLRETISKLGHHYTAKELRHNIEMYSVQGLEAIIRDKSYLLRVAEQEGEIIGVIECVFPVSGMCWIVWILVDEKHRRRGVGSALVRSLENPANGKWSRIWGGTRMSNTPSINMFKNMGYKKVRTRIRKIRKRNLYVWEKRLSDAI